jgi:hypothetical protein
MYCNICNSWITWIQFSKVNLEWLLVKMIETFEQNNLHVNFQIAFATKLQGFNIKWWPVLINCLNFLEQVKKIATHVKSKSKCDQKNSIFFFQDLVIFYRKKGILQTEY